MTATKELAKAYCKLAASVVAEQAAYEKGELILASNLRRDIEFVENRIKALKKEIACARVNNG